MENQDKGLDSIERRRLLADILKIPPALLGLAALPSLLKMTESDKRAPATRAEILRHTDDTVTLYQDTFKVYSDLHTTSTAQGSIADIERWIGRMEKDLPSASQTIRPSLQRTLWDFHALSVKIYSDDLSNWTLASAHLNSALQLATALVSPELQAASLYRAGQVHFAQGNYVHAQIDLDGAVLFAKHASPAIKGAVYASAGLAHALVGKDLASTSHAHSLIDQAEKVAHMPSANEGLIRFGVGKFSLAKADTYMALGRPGKALELLEEAEDAIDPTQQRMLAYLAILQAEASMKLKHPEFDRACTLLLSALHTSSKLNSTYNINYIKRLYPLLDKSSYATSPHVADLRLALRKL